MRLRYLLPAAFLLAFFCAPGAHADATYDFTFTCVSGNPSCITPSSGSFTYDSTTQTFSSIQVIWNGNTFNFTPSSTTLIGSLSSCYGSDTGQAAVFDLLDVCGPPDSTPPASCSAQWIGNSNPTTPTFSFEDDNAATCNFEFTLTASSSGGTTQLNGDYSEGSWTVTETPEPGTLLLVGSGLVLFVKKRARR